MRFVVITSLMVITIISGGAAWAEKTTPTNKEKIIGAWKLTKATALVFDEYVVTFTDDGKFTVDNQSAFGLVKGNYEVSSRGKSS